MATEKRLIDANRLKKRMIAFATAIKREYLSIEGIVDTINTEDTVDAVEVVHGRLQFLDIDGWWFDECSVCGNTTSNRDGSPPDWNYCPNCGAKMDK